MALGTKGGLLRFPRFLRAVVDTIKQEQEGRNEELPSLLYKGMRLRDAQLALALAVVFLALRLYLERRLVKQLFASHNARTRKKLCENLYYCVYYIGAFTFYLGAVLPGMEWGVNLLDGSVSMVRKLIHPFPPDMRQVERVYYAIAGGFYTSAMAFLLLFDTRRSDFGELLLHHVVTLGMVVMSYAYGYVRAGILILAMHDVGDIFLYMAKFVHYLGFKGLDTALFAVFAVTFYVTRLLMFSRMVFTICVETLQVLVEEGGFNEWAKYFDTFFLHYLFFSGSLITLLLLHCFWFTLILKMIYRELALGKRVSDSGDIRSDDEDEDDKDEDEKSAALEGKVQRDTK